MEPEERADQEESRPGIAVLGGSFNPLHVGHLRMAIELYETFGGQLERVDLLPTAHPPHKAEEHVLPFSVRVALGREAVAPYPWLHCNPLEGERSEKSYTWDTLGIFREREPGREIFFVLGSQDYASLSGWYMGTRLLERCSLLIVSRGYYTARNFREDTLSLWPEARPAEALAPGGQCMRTDAGRVIFQPLPWIEVSASLIRDRWLAGRCIDYLVPQGVVRLLEARRKEIRLLWR